MSVIVARQGRPRKSSQFALEQPSHRIEPIRAFVRAGSLRAMPYVVSCNSMQGMQKIGQPHGKRQQARLSQHLQRPPRVSFSGRTNLPLPAGYSARAPWSRRKHAGHAARSFSMQRSVSHVARQPSMPMRVAGSVKHTEHSRTLSTSVGGSGGGVIAPCSVNPLALQMVQTFSRYPRRRHFILQDALMTPAVVYLPRALGAAAHAPNRNGIQTQSAGTALD
jgi:hypothetical protein